MGIAFFLIASATILTTRYGGGVAFIWVANALLLAELSVTPRRIWLAPVVSCTMASIMATGLFGFGWVYALPLAVINVGEAILAAIICRVWRPNATRFASLDAIFVFVLAAGIVAPAFTGIGGALVAEAAQNPFWSNWFNWFAGHGLGALTFTPVLVLLLRGDLIEWSRAASSRRILEAVGTLALVGSTAVFVFVLEDISLLFLTFLPMIIATFRLGRFGAALSVIILSITGCCFTMQGLGPIANMGGGEGGQLQLLQLYLAVVVLIALPIAADLASRKQVLEALRDSEARYRLLTAKSSDIVMNLDTAGAIRFISPSIRILGGFEPSSLIGTDALDLVHLDDREKVRQTHLMALRSPDTPFIVDYHACRSDGKEVLMEAHTQGVLDEDGIVSGMVGVVRDISHRRDRELVLQIEADTDHLTSLLNRRGFTKLLQRFSDGSQDHLIAVFDIDHFKSINDIFGHAAGDEVLRNFASCAKAALREGDAIARLGGEEFAVLFERATTIEQTLMICERIRKSIENMVTNFEDNTIRITVSGGISVLPANSSAEDCLIAADAALYEAKRSGRNRLKLAA